MDAFYNPFKDGDDLGMVIHGIGFADFTLEAPLFVPHILGLLWSIIVLW